MDKELESIQKAEKEAQKRVDAARKEGERQLQHARDQTAVALQKEEEIAEGKRKESLGDIEKEFEKKKEAMLHSIEKSVEQLVKKAEKNERDVVAFIVRKFEEEIQ